MRIQTNLTGFLICLLILITIAIITQSEAAGCLVIINVVILIINIIRNKISEPKGSLDSRNNSSNFQDPIHQSDEEEISSKKGVIDANQGDFTEKMANYDLIKILTNTAIKFIIEKEKGLDNNSEEILHRYYIQSCVAKAIGIVFIVSGETTFNDVDSTNFIKLLFSVLNENYTEIACELKLLTDKLHGAARDISTIVGENFSINIIGSKDDAVENGGQKLFFSGVKKGKEISDFYEANI